jgi:DNA-binding SARP family transcriptional activator/tetratricopeptide (TPR) repeat protein
MLRVCLFGHVRLRIDGEEVRFATRPKVVPFLAYALLHSEQPIPRDAVAFLLWPDAPEETARANLRRHIGYLRESLPEGATTWLLVDPDTVQWNPAAPTAVDTVEFQRLVAEKSSWREAVDLYTGDFLTGWYDEWIIATRERLRLAYVGALWDLGVEARGRRDLQSAGDYLQRILSDDPWREDAARALMAVRYEAGDRAGALQVFLQLEERLRDEMGVAAMPETMALRDAIGLGQSLPTVPLRRVAEAGPFAAADLPFAGRDAEVARLCDAWEQAAGGAGALVLIGGEAGIGKTRLATEFGLLAESRGARVFWGTTSAPEATPYQAVTEVLRVAASFIEGLRLEAHERATLSRLLPELVDDAASQSLDADAERSRLFDVVAGILTRLAAQRPLLVVLEDLHRAGPASVAMVEHIARRVRRHPILIVGTAREAEATTADTLGRLRRLQDADKPVVVALGRLSSEVVERIATGVPLPGDDVTARSRLLAASEGHPLFLSELIRNAVETGHVGSQLPVRLRDAIADRVARLSSRAKFLLDAASVVGASFDLDVVGEVVGWSEAELDIASDELVKRHVIHESGSRSSFDFRFAHELIAVVTYEALSDRERRRWHRRTAHVAETYYARRLDGLAAFIARHFDQGGDGQAAAAHYLRAARTANALFANEEALSHAQRGLELQPVSLTLRFDLLALQEDMHDRLGDRAAQHTDLDALDEIAASLDDLDRRCEVLKRRGDLHHYFAEYEAERAVITQLSELARGTARWEAAALRANATLQTTLGSYAGAYETIRQAVSKFEEAGDDAGVVNAVTLQAHVAALLGRRDDAMACIERARAIVGADVSLPALRVAYCEATTLVIMNDWQSGYDASLKVLALATTIGDRDAMDSAHVMVGAACVMLFRVEDARLHLTAAVEACEDRDTGSLPGAYNNLATLELDVGRFAVAEQLAVALEAVAKIRNIPSGLTYAALIRCELALRRADYLAALDCARQLIDLARERADTLFEAEGLRCRGVALRELGDAKAAVAALSAAYGKLTKIETHEYARMALAELALACAFAQDARAQQFADEAAASIDAASVGIVRVAILWTLARTLHTLCRFERARGMLERAHDEFVRQAAQLSNGEDQRAFAEVPANVTLARAYAEGIWPPTPPARVADP